MKLPNWPVYRQLTGADHGGLGAAAKSNRPSGQRSSPVAWQS